MRTDESTNNQKGKSTMKTLEDLFLSQLADMYDAEHRISKALPKLAEAATNPQLAKIFSTHLDETKDQIEQLDAVFKAFNEKPDSEKCPAAVGLLEESDELVSEFGGSPANDAALICAAQKVEHYEIASYGCLRAWADELGNEEAADLLQGILDQEMAANEKLNELAVSIANVEAKSETTTDEGEERERAA